MQRRAGISIATLVAVASVPVASLWGGPAQAGVRRAVLAGTLSCTTSQGAMQVSAYAYRPTVGFAGAFIFTGPPNTPATIDLFAVQTSESKIGLDRRCSRTRASVALTHHGLTSAGVVKAGYNQSLTAYCGVPGRILIRYRIGYAGSGKPATAKIAIWARSRRSSKLREIGYVQWSRATSTTYYAPKSCVSQY